MLLTDEYFMREALKEAQAAFMENEVPIGAVIVMDKQIIAKAHNLCERLNDASAHAEMLAFTSASEYLSAKYLSDCTLYVTIEPCVMCAGAAYWTRIGRIVWAADEPKRGFFSTGFEKALHPKTIIQKGPLQEEAAKLMKTFFERKRTE